MNILKPYKKIAFLSVVAVLSFGLVVLADDVSTSVQVGNSAPSVSAAELNGASAIVLTENITTDIDATATVSDSNGCSTISTVVADFYRSGVGASSCDTDGEDNDNNCYARITCTVDSGTCTGGADTAADYTCTASLKFYAENTTYGDYLAQTWEVTIYASDGTATSSDSANAELNALTALDVTSSINYGTLSANSDTGTSNQTTTITNTGNTGIDAEISGTDMTSGSDTIPVANQRYQDTDGDYDQGLLLSSTPQTYQNNISKSTNDTPSTDNLYWGIGIDNGQPPGTYTGTNTFTAVADQGAPAPP